VVEMWAQEARRLQKLPAPVESIDLVDQTHVDEVGE